jgi:hypothetical protein
MTIRSTTSVCPDLGVIAGSESWRCATDVGNAECARSDAADLQDRRHVRNIGAVKGTKRASDNNWEYL